MAKQRRIVQHRQIAIIQDSRLGGGGDRWETLPAIELAARLSDSQSPNHDCATKPGGRSIW